MIEQGTPSGLTINFYPDSDLDPGFVAAASEYTDIWEVDGGRIVSTIEAISGLRFKETFINTVVFADPSMSHPHRLKFDLSGEIKKGALVHELVHRIIRGNNPLYAFSKDSHEYTVQTHKIVDLVLYDAWANLYGEGFARANVEFENGSEVLEDVDAYREAWNWALGMTRGQRAREFRKYFEFGPPAEWFTGAGKIATGISIVMPDPPKILPGDEAGQRELARHWTNFSHYIGNPVTSSDTDERKQRGERALAEAEIVITELTGFSPVAIRDEAIHLHELYRGREDAAPFEVQLFE